MRKHFVLFGALLLASVPVLAQENQSAQLQPPAQPTTPPAVRASGSDILGGVVQRGVFDVGFVGSSIDGDAARYQRYQDLRDGAQANLFRFTRDEGRWFVKAGADHVGRRDQKYFMTFGQPGRLKASFTWDQIPLYYSNDTATLYSNQGNGVFRIDDAIQSGIQNKQFTLASVAPQAVPISMRNSRDTALFDLTYSATRELDLKVNVRSFTKNGSQPWGASFGFSNDVELALPIDARTTDVNTSLEWANDKGRASLGYVGSWYDNRIPTIVWDNPIKITDSTYSSAYSAGDGTSQGRESIFPSNSMHSVIASGAINLPARSNASAFLSVGSMDQNQPLIPFTINTAIPTLPLERSTAEAKYRTVATNLNFTTRPNRLLWLTARYRYLDLNDRTPEFDGTEYVRFDQVLEDLGEPREPMNIKRQNFDAEASFTPIGFTAFKLSYGRASTDRTTRIFENTVENTVRASVDTTGNRYVTLRGVYEYSQRRGNGFDANLLPEIGEQPTLQHFDIADRNHNRVTAIFTVTPVSQLGVNFSAGAGRDKYPNSGFGLRNNDNNIYSAGFDLVPTNNVAFSFEYGYEQFKALQYSRTANPPSPTDQTFYDPRRTWSDNSNDWTKSVNASLDVTHIIKNTDVRLGYDFTQGRTTFVYGVADGWLQSVPALALPQQLPPVRNQLNRATADVRYFFNKKVSVGFAYWYTKYSVDDFAFNNSYIDNRVVPNGALFLGYAYRPYKANTTWLNLSYHF
jgi:MtrB/PioB family decaheme-associated outer membrane protein